MDSSPTAAPPPTPVITILLVEDSAVLAERLTEAMTARQPFKVVGTVDSEAAAIAFLERSAVDVVLLDLHLKQGTGFGVLRALESAPRRPVVVVLTNNDLPEYHQAALRLGATEFLDKARAFHRLPQILGETLYAFDVD